MNHREAYNRLRELLRSATADLDELSDNDRLTSHHRNLLRETVRYYRHWANSIDKEIRE